jgi:hypothetical protein
VDETDKFHGKPVYEVLLDIFFKKKIMGMSVFRGIAGYGTDGVFRVRLAFCPERDDYDRTCLPGRYGAVSAFSQVFASCTNHVSI